MSGSNGKKFAVPSGLAPGIELELGVYGAKKESDRVYGSGYVEDIAAIAANCGNNGAGAGGGGNGATLVTCGAADVPLLVIGTDVCTVLVALTGTLDETMETLHVDGTLDTRVLDT